MRIWVDADACPNVIKDILFRAAERTRIVVTLVANQPTRTPPSQYIKALQVPAGFDAADAKILELMQSGDLVITADLPLAASVIEKGAHALDPRGDVYTRDNIKERLAMRNFMDEMRSSGVDTGGPSVFSNADRMAFANRIDRFLANSIATSKLDQHSNQ